MHHHRAVLHRRALTALAAAAALSLAACGSDDGGSGDGTEAAAGGSSSGGSAEGQTVDWWMFGGDERLNAYVEDYVAPLAAEQGVTLNQVRITDTADAVDQVLAQRAAGQSDTGGDVDLIWVNGENFSTLKQADAWFCGWVEGLDAADLLDLDDPAYATDFGTPVEGCEMPWNRAQSVVLYDSESASAEDFADYEALRTYVESEPGSFTYPAPPDFTGSMVVRTFFYEVAEDAGQVDAIQGDFDQAVFDELAPLLWERLNALEPSLYRGGETYPDAQADVLDLFDNGEIDLLFTYDAGSVGGQVDDGTLPASTRSVVPEPGTIGNTNFVGIPANASDKEGAQVVADILLSAEAQLEKFTGGPGFFPVVDPALTDLEEQFTAVEVPKSELGFAELTEGSLPELQAGWLTALEDGWRAEVLQR